MERRARVVADARDHVLDVDLVLENHERDDIAVLTQILACIDETSDVGDVARCRQIERHRLLRAANDHVAHVDLRAVRTRYEPTAPAPPDRGLIAGQIPTLVRRQISDRIDEP